MIHLVQVQGGGSCVPGRKEKCKCEFGFCFRATFPLARLFLLPLQAQLSVPFPLISPKQATPFADMLPTSSQTVFKKPLIRISEIIWETVFHLTPSTCQSLPKTPLSSASRLRTDPILLPLPCLRTPHHHQHFIHNGRNPCREGGLLR
jgi:hypothetical protein